MSAGDIWIMYHAGETDNSLTMLKHVMNVSKALPLLLNLLHERMCLQVQHYVHVFVHYSI